MSCFLSWYPFLFAVPGSFLPRSYSSRRTESGVEFVEPLPLCSSCPCEDRSLCPPFRGRRVHGRVSYSLQSVHFVKRGWASQSFLKRAHAWFREVRLGGVCHFRQAALVLHLGFRSLSCSLLLLTLTICNSVVDTCSVSAAMIVNAFVLHCVMRAIGVSISGEFFVVAASSVYELTVDGTISVCVEISSSGRHVSSPAVGERIPPHTYSGTLPQSRVIDIEGPIDSLIPSSRCYRTAL